MIKGLDHFLKGWDCWPVHSGEEKAQGESHQYVCKYLKVGYQEDETRLFSVVYSDSMKSKGHKTQTQKVPLEHSKNFLTASMTDPWVRLPREVVYSPSLEVLKKNHCPYRPGQYVLGDPNSYPNRTKWSPRVPSNFNHSVIPGFCDSLKRLTSHTR